MLGMENETQRRLMKAYTVISVTLVGSLNYKCKNITKSGMLGELHLCIQNALQPAGSVNSASTGPGANFPTQKGPVQL